MHGRTAQVPTLADIPQTVVHPIAGKFRPIIALSLCGPGDQDTLSALGKLQQVHRVGRLMSFHKRRPVQGAEQKLQREDRKSTRLNYSHVASSYAVICMK